MKQTVIAICAIFALSIAGSVLAEETGHAHDGHVHDGQAATVYKCPMHKDAVSETPGKCPKCGMAMDKTQVAYRCPMHKDYVAAKSGKCPKCNMALEMYELGKEAPGSRGK
ncbi:MAG: hypothetical protein A3H42_04940 [Deltaproteobacteria bacterium RIFCSPLOWO2_02_FULL_46_8]|nr:MAG: hypothetical protein A3H42_04940 [Deltaproteobacteria bacterium RIFCSPLOWO2_02_FULL_46_8]